MGQSSGRIVNSLKDRGHEITVVHLVPDAKSTNPVHSGHIKMAGVNVPREPEAMFWSIEKELKDSVIVGFGGDMPGYLATLWAKWLGTRSVVLFRGNDFEKKIHDMKNAWMTHFVLSHADCVGAMSREMAGRISAFRSGPVVFTPNGIDTSEWTLLESDVLKGREWKTSRGLNGKPVVGVFGHLKYKKGLELAAGVFSSSGLNHDAHLLTAGEMPGEIRQRLSLDCGERWIDAGYIDRDYLPSCYWACDAVFIPSYFDGMPNVLLEAMALGRIVVASRAGGMPDVIDDGVTGFLFDAGDPVDASRVLKKALCLSREQREAIGTAARTLIENKYTRHHEAEIMESMFREDPRAGKQHGP